MPASGTPPLPLALRQPDLREVWLSAVAMAGLGFAGTQTRGRALFVNLRADDPERAKAFLCGTTVDEDLCHVTVETPGGTWGRDRRTIYLESLPAGPPGPPDCPGTVGALVDAGDTLVQAARGSSDNFTVVVTCGRCSAGWIDGVAYRDLTLLRCPACRAVNRVDSSGIGIAPTSFGAGLPMRPSAGFTPGTGASAPSPSTDPPASPPPPTPPSQAAGLPGPPPARRRRSRRVLAIAASVLVAVAVGVVVTVRATSTTFVPPGVTSLVLPTSARDLATTPNGDRVLVADGNKVLVVDTATNAVQGQFVEFTTPWSPALVAVAPDGMHALAAGGQLLTLDLRTGKPTTALDAAGAFHPDLLTGSNDFVYTSGLAVSHDGSHAAWSFSRSGQAAVTTVLATDVSGQVTRATDLDAPKYDVRRLLLSPDGSRAHVLAVHFGVPTVSRLIDIDLATGRTPIAGDPPSDGRPDIDIAMPVEGDRIYASGRNRIRAVDERSGAELAMFDSPGVNWGMAFSVDGRYLFVNVEDVGHFNGVRVFDTRSGRRVADVPITWGSDRIGSAVGPVVGGTHLFVLEGTTLATVDIAQFT